VYLGEPVSNQTVTVDEGQWVSRTSKHKEWSNSDQTLHPIKLNLEVKTNPVFPVPNFNVVPIRQDHQSIKVPGGPMEKEDGVSFWGVYCPDRPSVSVYDSTLMENCEVIFTIGGLSDTETVDEVS
jgi:hypothetical protein